MRTRVKVTDLNLRQWSYIIENVPVDSMKPMAGVPMVRVTFEHRVSELNVEMDLAQFTVLMLRLESIKNEPDVTALAAEALLSEGTGSGQDGDYPPGTKHVGPFELG